MTISGFNTVDLAIIGILGLFIVLGLIRGFTSDFLGFFTWIGAIFSTKILYNFVHPIVRKHVESLFFAELISIVVPFLLSLIVLVALVHFISRMVQGSIFGGLDRTLGLVSGFIRGSIILCIIYICILMYYKPGEKPEWLNRARTQPYLIMCTKFLYFYVIPQNLFPHQVKQHLFAKKYQEAEKSPDEQVKILSSPQPTQRKSNFKK